MTLNKVVGLTLNVTCNDILAHGKNFKWDLPYLGLRMLKDQSAKNLWSKEVGKTHNFIQHLENFL